VTDRGDTRSKAWRKPGVRPEGLPLELLHFDETISRHSL
jgi:hypothetical protein